MRIAATILCTVLGAGCSSRESRETCDYVAVARSHIREFDPSVSFAGSRVETNEDFEDARIVVIRLANQQHVGAAVSINRADCKPTDIKLDEWFE